MLWASEENAGALDPRSLSTGLLDMETPKMFTRPMPGPRPGWMRGSGWGGQVHGLDHPCAHSVLVRDLAPGPTFNPPQRSQRPPNQLAPDWPLSSRVLLTTHLAPVF